MVENNFLPLDLKESLFFETGYEIGEMISVSLDPEISIQKFSDYVSIRGVISLEGEYAKLTDLPEDYEEKRNERVEHIYRSVAKIATDTDERVNFYHHFPIEISVPFERISKLNDVTVSVEAFDYTLRDINEMKVAATLHINGIDQGKQQIPEETTEQSSVELGETLQFEVIKNEQTKKNEKLAAQKQSESIKDTIGQEEQLLTRVEQLKAKREMENKEVTKKAEKLNQIEERPADEKPVQEEPVREKIDQKESVLKQSTEKEDDLQEERTEQPMTNDKKEDVQETKQLDEARDPINITEQIDLTNDESSEEELKDVLYLAEMFNDEVEEDVYQMKLRIVQDDESLIEIADRYEIPAQKIMHINELEDENVVAGQLLLIPFATDE